MVDVQGMAQDKAQEKAKEEGKKRVMAIWTSFGGAIMLAVALFIAWKLWKWYSNRDKN